MDLWFRAHSIMQSRGSDGQPHPLSAAIRNRLELAERALRELDRVVSEAEKHLDYT